MTKEKNQFKILCFSDNETGRDVEMLLPLRYFSEQLLNCKFIHAFVYDTFAIYREMPDVVVVPNSVGSHYYFEISKYAKKQNIPVFALTSEGNFRTDGSFNYWGYNTDKKFYQEFICLWSERTAQFLKKEIPEESGRIVVTGGTGFDRYKIYDFGDKKEYLKRKGVAKEYSRIVGYAGWAFGKLANSQGVEELLYYFKYDKSKLDWVQKQRKLVEDALRYVIEKNPDTLFILKKHPNEDNPSIINEGLNEMNQLKDYENVLYLTGEESVHEAIGVSDIWLAFESTTALEAWLMGKETVFINPDPDFNRDPNYKGSVLVSSGEELQDRLNEFYSNEKLAGFYAEEKVEARSKIIKDTIGYDDGLNHVRAGYYLNQILKEVPERRRLKVRKLSFKYLLMAFLLYFGQFFYNRALFSKLPKFKKTVWVFERFRLKKIESLYQKYSKYLERFYKEKSIKERFNSGGLYKDLDL